MTWYILVEVLAADIRQLEGWVQCEAEKYASVLEKRHELEVNAFAEQLRLKDEKSNFSLAFSDYGYRVETSSVSHRKTWQWSTRAQITKLKSGSFIGRPWIRIERLERANGIRNTT